MTAFVLRCGGEIPPGVRSYRFRGSRGSTPWPIDGGRLLGAAGSWNFLFRIGASPAEVALAELVTVPFEAPLFVSLDAPLATVAAEVLRKRIDGGGVVIASGDGDAWRALLPDLFRGSVRRCEHPYAGAAYAISGRVELVAPPAWPCFAFESTAAWERTAGEVVFVSGERQTPSRAILTPLAGAPAAVRWRNFVFLNASPFHALQSWLQGQEDLQPWLAWRHRLFWLDEWVASMRIMLSELGVSFATTAAVPELGETCVVLRHDLDHSRDTSYLEREVAAGVPAVHALLRDDNRAFWVRELAKHPDHESAFHYNTARHPRIMNALRRLVGQAPATLTPAPRQIAALGLARQVRWARANGVGVATLHRHLSYLIYPEWVDAMAEAERAEPELLGGSSLFRSLVLRWGVDRVDGSRGTYADFPDSQFPYWMPFRLAHAGEGGRMLRTWESTSVMEPEPGMVEQMLQHRIEGLPQRVLTLAFHPAHARGTTFAAGGSLPEFEKILAMIRDSGATVLTLRSVYARLNEALAGSRPNA